MPYTKSALEDFLGSLEMVQFSPEVYDRIDKNPPIMGLAISGGGYRSMLTGTGFIMEMEKFRLFDSLSYISGLSGGSWILMDLIIHNFEVNSMLTDWSLDDGLLQGIPYFDIEQKDIISGINQEGSLSDEQMFKRSAEGPAVVQFDEFQDILDMGTIFFEREECEVKTTKRAVSPLIKLREFIFQHRVDHAEKYSGTNEKSTTPLLFDSLKSIHRILQFYIDLHLEVRPKKVKGFPVSFTDYLGKAFIKRLRKGFLHDINTTSFSQLAKRSHKFRNFQAPIPIFVANCKNGLLKNVIFEFTPFEFGSWDKLLKLFVKLPYLGSRVIRGKAIKCFNGFDDIGFITATSSSIFNNVLIYVWELTSQSSKETIRAVRAIMSIFGLGNSKSNTTSLQPSYINRLNTDYAVYQPNPFYKYPGVSNELTNNDYLYLVDGGEDGENIPLRSLLVPERKLDMVFIIDSSSDKDNYANGTKLQNILRLIDHEERHFVQEIDFTLQNPIALGCHDKTLPVILYYANSEHSYASNMSTFKITYNESEVFGMLENGGKIFNSDSDNYYKNCLGCLILKRSLDCLQSSAIPSFCYKCYDDFCR